MLPAVEQGGAVGRLGFSAEVRVRYNATHASVIVENARHYPPVLRRCGCDSVWVVRAEHIIHLRLLICLVLNGTLFDSQNAMISNSEFGLSACYVFCHQVYG